MKEDFFDTPPLLPARPRIDPAKLTKAENGETLARNRGFQNKDGDLVSLDGWIEAHCFPAANGQIFAKARPFFDLPPESRKRVLLCAVAVEGFTDVSAPAFRPPSDWREFEAWEKAGGLDPYRAAPPLESYNVCAYGSGVRPYAATKPVVYACVFEYVKERPGGENAAREIIRTFRLLADPACPAAFDMHAEQYENERQGYAAAKRIELALQKKQDEAAAAFDKARAKEDEARKAIEEARRIREKPIF